MSLAERGSPSVTRKAGSDGAEESEFSLLMARKSSTSSFRIPVKSDSEVSGSGAGRSCYATQLPRWKQKSLPAECRKA